MYRVTLIARLSSSFDSRCIQAALDHADSRFLSFYYRYLSRIYSETTLDSTTLLPRTQIGSIPDYRPPSPSGLHHKVQNHLLGTLQALHNPCSSSFIVPQLSYIYILTSLQHDLCKHRTETCLVIWSSARHLPQELVYACLKASSHADANIRSSLL